MRGLQASFQLMKFLPLIGFVAFYFDSSFVDLRLFFSRVDPISLNSIYFAIFAGCILTVIALLYVIHHSFRNNIRVLGNLSVFNRAIILSQSIIIGVLILTLVQNYSEVEYYLSNVSILLILSYSIGLFFMLLSACTVLQVVCL